MKTKKYLKRLGAVIMCMTYTLFLIGCNKSAKKPIFSDGNYKDNFSDFVGVNEYNLENSTDVSCVTITNLKVYETYSCYDGDYYYTFDSTIPQFNYNNSTFSAQQNKLNQYFKDRQNDSNESTNSEIDYKKIDRSLIEDFLSENSMYNTSTTQKYEILQMEEKYCTILMSNYWYGGGAHGGSWIEGYFIDILNGDVLMLSDLFQSTNEFRHYVANYFYTEYYSEYSKLWGWNADTLYELFDSEAGSNWYIKDDNLFVEYGDYALGSYVDGHQLLSIPLDICRYYWTDKSIDIFDSILPNDRIIQ